MTPQRSIRAGPSKRARFLILETPVGVSVRKHILGSVIPKRNTANPFELFRPAWDDDSLSPEDLQQLEAANAKLWKEEEGAGVTLTDTTVAGWHQLQTGVQAQLTDFFRASLSKARNQEIQIKAGQIRRFTIINTGVVVPKQLFNCAPWMRQLQLLYDGLGPLYPDKSLALVTSVVTCKGLEVSWKKDASADAQFGARVPVGQIMGGGPAIANKMDIVLAVDAGKSTGTEVIANCPDEVIFALGYHDLSLDLEEPTSPDTKRNWLQFWKKTPAPTGTRKILKAELGDPIRDEGIDSYAGPVPEEDQITIGDFYYKEPIFVPLVPANKLASFGQAG